MEALWAIAGTHIWDTDGNGVLAFDNGHLERDRLDVFSEKGPDEWGEDML